eukprot:GFUD01040620.1.p1 GENE.GFUD01040620.1~~GFUD01040620.1.p1  ORF type:complete len:276 (-),score=55.74 GFUD01040620.1:118-945(-)
MQTKNLCELSSDELRVECLRRGVQLRGDCNMVEAVVALTKKLLMDGRDPIKEEFCTGEVTETKTKSSPNNSIIQEAVVALTKKLLVESLDPKEADDKASRKRSTGPGVIVSKSSDASSKTWPITTVANSQKKSVKALFPNKSTSTSSLTPPYPIPYPMHTHAVRISSRTSVYTQSTTGGSKTPLTQQHHHPHPQVIQFHEQAAPNGRKAKEIHLESSNKSDQLNKDDVMGDTQKVSKAITNNIQTKTVGVEPADLWLESLHRGLDRIFFPEGCKL